MIVKRPRVYERVFREVADFKIGEERCLLAERTADFAFQSEPPPGWLLRREGIPRIENITAVVSLNLAVEILTARLCKHLNPSRADAIVLRREGVLVDADLADGSLGREASTGEAI